MNIYPMPNGDVELGDYPYRISKDWCNVVWIITEQCNLGCPYCIGFKSTGRAKSLIDVMGVGNIIENFERMSEKSGKKLYFTLTGGEPTIVPKFTELCQGLTSKGFHVELQSNLLSKYVKEWCDAMDPSKVSQIVASYHGWKLDTNDALRKTYMDNFEYATRKGFTCVLKTIVPPKEVPGIEQKVKWLKNQIPPESPLLVWLYIEGQQYPYAYTPEEREILKRVRYYRKDCQQLFIEGGGYFKGMHCSAGEGFFVMDWNGRCSRCYTFPKTGSFVLETFDLTKEPQYCSADWCQTSFWGLWYGVDPLKYIPKASCKDTYFCRHGKENVK